MQAKVEKFKISNLSYFGRSCCYLFVISTLSVILCVICLSFIFVTSVLSDIFCHVNFVCHFDRHFLDHFWSLEFWSVVSAIIWVILHIAKMFFSRSVSSFCHCSNKLFLLLPYS